MEKSVIIIYPTWDPWLVQAVIQAPLIPMCRQCGLPTTTTYHHSITEQRPALQLHIRRLLSNGPLTPAVRLPLNHGDIPLNMAPQTTAAAAPSAPLPVPLSAQVLVRAAVSVIPAYARCLLAVNQARYRR